MKKRVLITAAAVCLAMLLSGCSAMVEKLGERFFESEEEHSRPKGSSSSSSSSSSSESAPYERLSVDDKLLEAAYSNMLITMDISNNLSTITRDMADQVFEIYEVQDLLTDEYYNAVNVITKKYSSKREYVKEVLESHPNAADWFDEDGNLNSPPREPTLFIEFSSKNDYNREIDPDVEKQAFLQAAEWIISELKDRLLNSIKSEMTQNNIVLANVEYSIDYSNRIEVRAEIDLKDKPVIRTYNFQFRSKNGFLLGSCFVPYDTEKLAVSDLDSQSLSETTGDFIPNDCKIICRKDFPETYDLAEIAAKLPNLKELYLYQAIVINQESIADMKNLEALLYYVRENIRSYEAIPDCPFKELKNLRSLRLYADYDDYSFLSEMPQLTDIHIDINAAKHDPSFFFDYPAITSLKINLPGNNPNFSLDGIEKLKNLKKLDIDCLTLDFTPLGKLENLEELEIECWSNAINISELSKAPKLKTLHLSYMDDYDWGFLQQMENLTDLSLSYVSGIRNSDIEPLKQLKSLTLDNSGCGVSVVAKLPNLESYSESMSEGGDFSSLKNCPNLRKLYLSECRSGVMDCAYIQNAPLEIFDCQNTEIANVELLADIKTLKKITIYTDEPKAEWSNILKEALPDCQISIH